MEENYVRYFVLVVVFSVVQQSRASILRRTFVHLLDYRVLLEPLPLDQQLLQLLNNPNQ